jgi:hypothetical protein
MYETFPKKASAGKAGSISGWKGGHGTSYPNTKPSKEDDHHKVKCNMQKTGSGSPAKKSYPKNPGYGGMFSNLNGLPS